MAKCPGQDQRYWKPEDIFELKCPGCGAEMEFWKDEPRRKCRGCGEQVWNPKIDLGCAKWCQYADQCLGDLMKNKDAAVLCDTLIAEMKAVFAGDQRRIDHAMKVLEYADQIQSEEGGEGLVVKAAAILHDIGIKRAEEVHGSAGGKYQEIKGPPIAREILDRHGVAGEATEHICKIIANHHSAKDIDTLEFRIIWDADWLVNIPDICAAESKEKLGKKIEKLFKTGAGKKLASQMFTS